MMKKFFISMLAGTLLLTGCSEDSAVSQYGGIAVKVEVDSRVIYAGESRSSLDDLLGSFTPDQLKVKFEHESGKHVYNYDSFDAVPTTYEFPIGNYTVTAYIGDVKIEGIDQPALEGKTTIEVFENRNTPVSITATLANSIMNVEYTDNFKAYMSSYYTQLSSSSGQTYNFPSGSDSNVFFKPGSTSVTVNYVKPDGKSGQYKIQQFDAKPQYLYKVTFDVSNTSGQTLLNVTYSDDKRTIQKSVDLSKDVDLIPEPYLIARGFDSQTTTPIKFIEYLPYSDDLDMQLIAMGGIQSVKLSTNSYALCQLVDVDFPNEIELMGASEADKEKLRSYGLEVTGLWDNSDHEMGIIDFGSILKSIRYTAGDNSKNITTFTVVVTDNMGRESEPMTLTLQAVPLELEMISTDETPYALGMYEEEAHVHLQYSGGVQFKDELKFYYWDAENNKEVLTEVHNIRVTPPEMNPDNEKDHICAFVKVPGTHESVTIIARCGTKKTSAEFNRVGSFMYFNGEYADNEKTGNNWVFATTATIGLNTGAIDRTNLEVYARKEGESDNAWKKVQSTVVDPTSTSPIIKVSGLEPDTDYELEVRSTKTMEGQKGEPITTEDICKIHTEAALQLPNGNMDKWSKVDGKSDYYWIAYPGANTTETVWGTMNQLTTSQGGSSTAWYDDNRNGCSYNAYSGTREDTNGRNGSCAVISTVGWGEGNRATGGTGSSACRNITVGELYLSGSCNVAEKKADYRNYEFTSRPSGLRFWYKYVPKNSADYGVAEINVFDATGKSLIEKPITINITNQTDWKESIINLTYPENPLQHKSCAKAAFIQVKFKSSGNSSCQTISNSNLNCPNFGNTDTGRFYGSEMYIDDIELIY